MNYNNLMYLLKVREYINGVFVWSLWGDGERLYFRIQEGEKCYLKPMTDVL